jgi:hypothetical protein
MSILTWCTNGLKIDQHFPRKFTQIKIFGLKQTIWQPGVTASDINFLFSKSGARPYDALVNPTSPKKSELIYSCGTTKIISVAGLPDGLFSNQNYQFWKILEGLCLENVAKFYGHLEYLTDIWDIL